MMVEADLARAALLVPVAVAALTGHLPLWALVAAAFLLVAGALVALRGFVRARPGTTTA